MIRPKLGRNDPCWCGSGTKYKRCHLSREDQPPLQHWDASKKFKKAFSAKKCCLAPDTWLKHCRGGISHAHTVPKSGSLKRIARKGHVYSYVPSLENLRKHEGALVPKRLGIKGASTFTGFCSRHDNQIFVPLEKRTFCGTPEQCFLLGYRALAREIYTKRAAAAHSDVLQDADKGKTLSAQIAIQTVIQANKAGLTAALKDVDHYKPIYDGILNRCLFDTVRGYVIEFEDPPPVMCSGGFFPEQDFNGVQLQDFADRSSTPDLLCFSSFYGGERGVVAFSWLAESDRTCCAFIESLKAIPDEFVTAALLRLFFEHCENVHMNPDWWESLPVGTRNALNTRTAMSADLFKGRPEGVLKDDGVFHSPWTIVRRYEIQLGG